MNKIANPTLFPLEEKPRASHREDMKALKEKYSIQTHHCSDQGWMALSMTEAAKMLKGYGLTESEKTNLFDIMAGYCRLLDEAGIIADDCKTEYEACKQVEDRIEANK